MDQNPYKAPDETQQAGQQTHRRKPPWMVIFALFVLSAMSGMGWWNARADMKDKFATSP